MLEKTLEDQLRIKTSCLDMMEVLYLRLSAQELNSTESEINRAYNKGERMTGKELTKAITKWAIYGLPWCTYVFYQPTYNAGYAYVISVVCGSTITVRGTGTCMTVY